jgi:hypothetical protein
LLAEKRLSDFPTAHQPMELLATDPLLPVRIVAAIAFIAMICAYVYVLRHLRKIEKTIVADNLVPSELGARNNMVLMVCLIPDHRHGAFAVSDHHDLSNSALHTGLNDDVIVRGIFRRVRAPLRL